MGPSGPTTILRCPLLELLRLEYVRRREARLEIPGSALPHALPLCGSSVQHGFGSTEAVRVQLGQKPQSPCSSGNAWRSACSGQAVRTSVALAPPATSSADRMRACGSARTAHGLSCASVEYGFLGLRVSPIARQSSGCAASESRQLEEPRLDMAPSSTLSSTEFGSSRHNCHAAISGELDRLSSCIGRPRSARVDGVCRWRSALCVALKPSITGRHER
mmetsp:Transcript_28731/g.61811  ORF Transcript_28731/g.61811 Transcript_28731/m.61811 type:complete len:219 (+) Transcript_28731:199-855(+)